jgi:hypothetical protein
MKTRINLVSGIALSLLLWGGVALTGFAIENTSQESCPNLSEPILPNPLPQGFHQFIGTPVPNAKLTLVSLPKTQYGVDCSYNGGILGGFVIAKDGKFAPVDESVWSKEGTGLNCVPSTMANCAFKLS